MHEHLLRVIPESVLSSMLIIMSSQLVKDMEDQHTETLKESVF